MCEVFGDYNKVAKFSKEEIEKLRLNKKIIFHRTKISDIVYNAKQFLSLLNEFGSAEKYISSFSLEKRLEKEKLENLKKDLSKRFRRFGPATTDHFLQRIGFPFLKGDIIIRRLFYRLQITKEMLSTSEKDEKKIAEISKHIANLFNIPVTCIDELFHWFGRIGEQRFVHINLNVAYA